MRAACVFLRPFPSSIDHLVSLIRFPTSKFNSSLLPTLPTLPENTPPVGGSHDREINGLSPPDHFQASSPRDSGSGSSSSSSCRERALPSHLDKKHLINAPPSPAAVLLRFALVNNKVCLLCALQLAAALSNGAPRQISSSRQTKHLSSFPRTDDTNTREHIPTRSNQRDPDIRTDLPPAVQPRPPDKPAPDHQPNNRNLRTSNRPITASNPPRDLIRGPPPSP
jgi:hypothetical protein